MRVVRDSVPEIVYMREVEWRWDDGLADHLTRAEGE
jgi:hypothetical protein